MKKIKKILITGTKGKTSTVNILYDFLKKLLLKDCLLVSNDFIELGDLKINTDEVKEVFGLIPSVCPGKSLSLAFFKNIDYAILETSIGCLQNGKGLKNHNLGLLTNIFDDHIGEKGRNIFNRNDLTQTKLNLLLGDIDEHGTVILNISDKIVLENLSKINYPKTINFIYITENSSDIKNEGIFFLLDKKEYTITFFINGKKEYIFNFKNSLITFSGNYFVGLYLISFVLSVFYGFFGKKYFSVLEEKLQNYQMNQENGRLSYFKSEGKNIIIDYAHEKKSLDELLKLLKQINKNGKVYFVFRVDQRFSIEKMEELGKIFKNYESVIEELYLYDKVDGVNKKEIILKGKKYGVGEVMNNLYNSIKKHNNNLKITKKLIGTEAFKEAFEKAKKEDYIIYIYSDLERELKEIKNFLKNSI